VGLRTALYITKKVHSTRSRDKVYQLLAHGWRLPPLKAESGVKHNKSNQIKFNPVKITF
jgi:hypothetical protein